MCFQVFICQLCNPFGEISVHIFWYFCLKMGCLFPYYWFMRVLCIFWILALYQKCGLQIFLFILWLFILPVFRRAEVFNFNKFNLSIFTLMLYVSYLRQLWPQEQRFSPMFPSRDFIISGLTFRSLTHFELIFVLSWILCWVKFCILVWGKRTASLFCMWIPSCLNAIF